MVPNKTAVIFAYRMVIVAVCIALTTFPVRAGTDTLVADSFSVNPFANGWQRSSSSVVWSGGAMTIPSNQSLISKKFPVVPFEYISLTFRSRAPDTSGYTIMTGTNKNATWGRDLTSSYSGRLIADNGGSVYRSSGWITTREFSRALINADSNYIEFRGKERTIYIDNVVVTRTTEEDVRAWQDSIYALWNVPCEYTWLPADRLSTRTLPRTISKLTATGQRLRILLIGDSIINDTNNSLFEVMLRQLFPGVAAIEVIPVVNGSASIANWVHPEYAPSQDYDLQASVIDLEPDLVMLGGISTAANAATYSDIRTLIDLIRGGVQAKYGYQPDIMLLSPVFGDWNYNPKIASNGWYRDVNPSRNDYRSNLYRIAQDKNCCFFDITGVWGQYIIDLQNAGFPYQSFFRDVVHANPMGKQTIARCIRLFFNTTVPVKPEVRFDFHSGNSPERVLLFTLDGKSLGRAAMFGANQGVVKMSDRKLSTGIYLFSGCSSPVERMIIKR